MAYIGYQLLFFIANYFPKKATYPIGKLIGKIGYYLLGERRKFLIKKNTALLKDEKKAISVTKKVFENFILNLIDFFSTYSKSAEEVLKSIRFTNLETLQNIINEKKSAILSSVHIGNWELFGAALAHKGIPIIALVLMPKDKKSWSVFDKIHKKLNVGIIYTDERFYKEISQRLKNHQIIGIMSDVPVEDLKNSFEIPFLGQNFNVSPLISILAKRYNLPIIPIHTIRQDTVYEIVFGEPITPLRNESDYEIMNKVLSVSEDFIKEYPEQYYYLKFRKD